MKLIKYLFLFFILSAPVYADFHGNASIGYVPELKGIATEINLNYLPWRWLDLSTGIEVLADYNGIGNSGLSFCPYRDTYWLAGKINIKEHIYIKFYHSCTHPVFSYSEQFWDKFEGGNRTTYSIGVQW
jgi:hypothetical protein